MKRQWVIFYKRYLNFFPFSIFFSSCMYNQFGKDLGYCSWKGMLHYTYPIHEVPNGDIGCCYATLMPSGKWSIWEDDGYPPYPYTEFANWQEAILSIKESFKRRGIDPERWMLYGYDEDDNEFIGPPDPKKRNTCKYPP